MTDLPYRYENPEALRLRDPLSDVTRRERRALLGVALLSIAVAHSGLLPTEIAALGVKLETKEQRTLLILLAAVCAYFLFAFIAYAASDFTAWQLAIRESIYERMIRSRMNDPDEYDIHIHGDVEDRIAKHYPWLALTEVFVKPVSIMRALFEFALPVAVGAAAIVVVGLKSAA